MNIIKNINWEVRFKNPVFWAELAAAIVLPMLTAVGLNWNDITTWKALGDVIVAAFGNPVVVVAICVSVWNVITDPTTAGICDSALAMTYSKPRKDDTAEEEGL